MVKVDVREIPIGTNSVAMNQTSWGAVRQLWLSIRFATLMLSMTLEKEKR
jgi:hypothetical protein